MGTSVARRKIGNTILADSRDFSVSGRKRPLKLKN